MRSFRRGTECEIRVFEGLDLDLKYCSLFSCPQFSCVSSLFSFLFSLSDVPLLLCLAFGWRDSDLLLLKNRVVSSPSFYSTERPDLSLSFSPADIADGLFKMNTFPEFGDSCAKEVEFTVNRSRSPLPFERLPQERLLEGVEMLYQTS